MANVDISMRLMGDQELVQALHRLSTQDVQKAIRAGVRDAARAGRTTLAKSIGQRYSLSARRIKQDVSQPKFSYGGTEAVLYTSREPITAMQFRPRQTKKGLSMLIYRGKRTTVLSGFLQTSTEGVFPGTLPFKPNTARRYRGDTKGETPRAKPRAGMDVIHGPSIHAIYTGGHWAPALQARTELRIEQALEDGIIRSLRGMGRGFGRA